MVTVIVTINDMISGSRDYSVKGWDTETGNNTVEYSVPRNIVTALEFEPTDSALLFQGSEDLCVRVWDTKIRGRLPCMHISGFVYFPLSLSVHSSRNYLATGKLSF